MTFKELETQEKEELMTSKNHNILLSCIILSYFIGLVILMNIDSSYTLLDNFVNLVIASLGVYLSFRFKDKNLEKTITYKIQEKLCFDYVELKEKESSHKYNIKIETLRGIGYIFTYKDSKYLYTSLDDSIKQYVVD